MLVIAPGRCLVHQGTRYLAGEAAPPLPEAEVLSMPGVFVMVEQPPAADPLPVEVAPVVKSKRRIRR